MPRRLLPLIALLLLGCPADKSEDAPPAPSPADARLPDAAPALQDAGLDATPPDLGPSEAYAPEARYPLAPVEALLDQRYTDALGVERSYHLALYRPRGAPEPLPVVLLSHGGAGGKTDPLRSMDQWAPRIAAAGYLAVALAHPGRGLPGDPDYDALCAHLDVPPPPFQCAIKIHWDRPHDVMAALDVLEQQAAGAWAGRIDLSRVAHVGHSAGAGAALMLAGAPRNFRCAQPLDLAQGSVVPCDPADLISLAEPRIHAVVGLSPQGPDDEGFVEASFAAVTGPILLATGQADSDPPMPANRARAFDFLADSPGDPERFALYVDDPGAAHGYFEGESGPCERAQTPERCETLLRLLTGQVLAFLDHSLKARPEAAVWLRTVDPATLDPVLQWRQR